MDRDLDMFDLEDLFFTVRDPSLRAFNRLIFTEHNFSWSPKLAVEYFTIIRRYDHDSLHHISEIQKQIEEQGMVAVRNKLKFLINVEDTDEYGNL